MTVWLTRAGSTGEGEDFALVNGVTVTGWGELGDLAPIASRAAMKDKLNSLLPQAKPGQVANWAGQIWSFKDAIAEGDLVVLPLKTRSAIAIGRVTGPYEYRPHNPLAARHVRTVEWLRDDIPRSAFDQDILYSFGAFMTVCRISRNDAEARIAAVLAGSGKTVKQQGPRVLVLPDEEPGVIEALNIAENAADQIRSFITARFMGHGLARLVDAVLKDQGFRTYVSPEGADGGVDIVAGYGPMGFDSPRICVQVKSGSDPADVRVLRELQGVMNGFGADQGLLVSWGGFKRTVVEEARRHYFKIRLWDSGDLIAAITEHYEGLADDLKAELPMKRIWTIVPEE